MSEKCHVCEREKGKMPLCGRGLPGATFADLADCYQVAYGLARRDLAAAEERGRRAEHERAQGVIHVLHQCIRGKCDCGPGQFACEETARTVIDSWDADRAGKV